MALRCLGAILWGMQTIAVSQSQTAPQQIAHSRLPGRRLLNVCPGGAHDDCKHLQKAVLYAHVLHDALHTELPFGHSSKSPRHVAMGRMYACCQIKA